MRDKGEKDTEVPLAEILSEYFNLFSICSETENFVAGSVPRNTLVFSREEERGSAILNLRRKNNIDTVFIEDPDSLDTLKEILFLKYHGINVLVRENKPFSYPLFAGKPELMTLKEKVYQTCDLLICSNEADALFWRGLGIGKAIHLPLFLKTTSVPSFPNIRGNYRVLLMGTPNPLNGLNDLMEIVRHVCYRSEHIVFEVFDAFASSYEKSRFAKELAELISQERVVLIECAEHIKERIQNVALLLVPPAIEGKEVYVAEAQSAGIPILRMCPHALNILENCRSFSLLFL